MSAVICGYVVSRKARAYAEVVRKHADPQDAHRTEEERDAETVKASPAAPSKMQVLVSHSTSPRHSAAGHAYHESEMLSEH